VALAVLIAIAKPWAPGGSAGQPGGIATAAPPTAPPTVDPATLVDPAIGFSSRAYDPKIFGYHEPPAAWGIWPAGFLVTFGFVIQVPDVPGASTSPSTSGVGPRASNPAGPGSGDESSFAWPQGFEVPDGNHLLLIGINMPLGHSVLGTILSRLDPTSGAMVQVAVERLKSPWPSHFVVVALAGATADLLNVWPAGHYRLDVTFGPEGVTRSIEIIVAPSH
jgi:hypothetical protein